MKKKILVVFLICCMFFAIASPAMAADETFPDFTPSNPDVDYIVFKGTDSSILWKYPDHQYIAYEIYDYGKTYNFDYNYYFVFEDGSWKYFIFNDANGGTGRSRYAIYVYNGTKWELSSTGSTSGFDTYSSNVLHHKLFTSSEISFEYLCDSSEAVYYSNFYTDHDGYVHFFDLTSTVFPQAPPDPMVNLAEQMMKKTPEALDLDGKMKILAPFGISCLALLISLPLLSNLLRRFLN